MNTPATSYNLPVLFLRELEQEAAQAYPALAKNGAALVRALDQAQLPALDYVAACPDQRRLSAVNVRRR